MSEDKMREEHWRQWSIAGMPKDKIRLAEETWKAATEACAAIKDAEIADLQHLLSECRKLLTDEQNTRLSRDLMIKELREAGKMAMRLDYFREHNALATAMKNALANSEHHNSKVLEKMLLDERMNTLEQIAAWHPLKGNWQDFVRSLTWDCKVKLAELNKE